MLNVPLTALVPLHAPEAVHEVAFVEDQVKVDPLPLATLVGFALIETVGGGGLAATVTVAAWLAVPPAPVQLKA